MPSVDEAWKLPIPAELTTRTLRNAQVGDQNVLKNTRGILSINALRAWVYVGGHFRGLRVFSCFVRFLVKEIGINLEKCIECGK